MTTGRDLHMLQVYQNVIQKFLSPNTESQDLVVPCHLSEQVEAFNDESLDWTPVRLMAMGGGDRVMVRNWDLEGPQTEGWWEASRTRLRKWIRGQPFACSVPKCVDTDYGVKSKAPGRFTCSDFSVYNLYCHYEDEIRDNMEEYNDDDFQIEKLCCQCGGGTRNLTSAGIGQLPVNVSLQTITEPGQLGQYNACMAASADAIRQKVCIQKYTTIPQWLFDVELATFAPLCLVPDAKLCHNLGELLAPYENYKHSIQYAIPVFLRLAGFESLADLQPEEICRRTVKDVCPMIFDIQLDLFDEQRAAVCGNPITQVTGQVTYEAASSYDRDSHFGLTSLEFRLFLLLITLLWGLASIQEFRNILVWWNALLSWPSKGVPTLDEEVSDESSSSSSVISVRKASVCHPRWWMVFLANLLPRTVLQFFIFMVGIYYLLSVRSVSDLILNSLALTFLVTVDEMLFEAFASEEEAAQIERCEPIRGRFLYCVDAVLQRTRMSLGLWISLPLLVTVCSLVLTDTMEAMWNSRLMSCLCELTDVYHGECMAPTVLARTPTRPLNHSFCR